MKEKVCDGYRGESRRDRACEKREGPWVGETPQEGPQRHGALRMAGPTQCRAQGRGWPLEETESAGGRSVHLQLSSAATSGEQWGAQHDVAAPLLPEAHREDAPPDLLLFKKLTLRVKEAEQIREPHWIPDDRHCR